MKATGEKHMRSRALGAEGCTCTYTPIKAVPPETLQVLPTPHKTQKLQVCTLSKHAAHLSRQLVIYQAGLRSAVEKKDAGLIRKWAQVIARTAHSLSNCSGTCS